MFSKNLKTIRSVNEQLKRYLSSAQPKQQQQLPVQVSTLPSGILLASCESESPLARIAVMVRAGARYEPKSQLGISHLIRSAAGMATQNFSAFGITRRIEYHGGRLTVAGNRDAITYLLEVHNDGDIVPEQLSMICDTIARPAFKHWEIADNCERLHADRSLMEDTPFIQLTEMLHNIAFKGGCRNSLYVPKFMIGKHSTEDLKKYHQQTFVGPNTAVVGIGVDHEQLSELIGKNMILPASAGLKDTSSFIGGEYHLDSSSPLTYISIGCEGASANKSIKDYIAAQLIQKILGDGSQIKNSYELNQVQRLGRALSLHMAGKPTDNVSVSAFNYNYENIGIFGFNLVVPNNYEVPALTKALVKEFRATCNSVTDAELNDAKTNLKTSTLISMDNEGALAHEIAFHLLMIGQKFSVEDYLKAIDSVTTADLKSLGSRMLKSKVAMVSIGQNAPYLQDVVE